MNVGNDGSYDKGTEQTGDLVWRDKERTQEIAFQQLKAVLAHALLAHALLSACILSA